MPRNAILITCPHCGFEQTEPGMVISTVCRGCQAHLKPSSCQWRKLRPSLSDRLRGLLGLANDSNGAVSSATAPPAEGHGGRIRPSRSRGSGLSSPSSDAPSSAAPLEAQPDRDHTNPAPASRPILEQKQQVGTPGHRRKTKKSPALSPSPTPPSGGRQSEFLRKTQTRTLVCLECLETYEAPRIGAASTCPHCNTRTRGDDVRIENVCDDDILTHGNVIIGRRGVFRGKRLRCRQLSVYGMIDTTIHVLGRVEINGSATLHDFNTCQEMAIARKGEVLCRDRLFTRGVIRTAGRLSGNIFAATGICLEKGAVFSGDITTRHIETDPDAVFEARTNIVADPEAAAHAEQDSQSTP